MEALRKIYTGYLRWQKILVLLGLILISAWAVYLYTDTSSKYGIGINSDSISYIRSAENVVNGVGLGRVSGLGTFKPMTHWPPLYSFALAAIHSTGADIYDGARWFGAAMVFLIVLLTGLVIFRLTGSPAFSLAGAVLFVYAPPMWETTLRIMSEPLFLVLALLGILALDRYTHQYRLHWLILASIWMGLAFVTRYAALALVGAGALALLLYPGRPMKDRWKSAIQFGLISCIPIAVWLIYNQINAGTGTNRFFAFTDIPASDYQQLWINVKSWFEPLKTTFQIGSGKLLFGGVIVAAAIAVFFITRKYSDAERKNSSPFMGWLFLVYAPVYAIFVVFSRYYFDSMIKIFRERITFPFYLAVFILAFWFIAWLWKIAAKKHVAAGAVVLLLISFVWVSMFQGYKADSEKTFKQVKNNGFGFASLRYEPPEMVAAYKELPPSNYLLSNNIELFYLLTGQDALTLSEDITDSDLQKLTGLIGDKSAYFILFNSPELDTFFSSQGSAFTQVYKDTDESIYRYH